MASAPRNKSHAHDFHSFHKPFASSSASAFASKSPTFFTRRSCSPSPSVRFSIDQRPNSPGRSSISVTKQETSKKINNTVSSSSSSSSSSHNRAVPNFQKKTCSCSPTTHPGSFRCSLHKASSSSTSTSSTRGSGQRTASYGLNFRRSAMTNSLVRIGTVEGDDKQYYKCELCKDYKDVYTYRCSRCDFNLHITCASLAPTMDAEFHHHPLTPFWKWITFTCDLCGKEDKGTPYVCLLCGFWIHGRCSHFPRRVKIGRHKHILHLTHSSLEFHQSNSRFCQICVEKLDTHFGLYYCFRCDYVAHLDCAMMWRSDVDINWPEFRDEDEVPELNESIDSATYQVKKSEVGVDGTQIDTEIKHFSHEHDLKLTDKVLNDQKCNGCARALLGPFYSCSQCGFYLHKSCANLPKTMRLQLLPVPLTLIPTKPGEIFQCDVCKRGCNGFSYHYEYINLDVQCTLTLASDILTHKGHEHQLILSTTEYEQTCTSCNSETKAVFRCTICEFALDDKCVTLPYTTRYKQHEHPFTLCYTVEDDSNEYYCDICEEERDPKHWFYYCENCIYPAHPNCILGKYTNIWFGDTYTFGFHPHPLTFIEETEDSPECHDCGDPCKEFILQCVQCDFYIHDKCVWGEEEWF